MLAGRKFLSTAVTEDGVPRRMPPGTRVWLWFTPDGRLLAEGGCNVINGQVEVSDGRITMPEMRITERGCADELMQVDRWLCALLDARPSWQLSGPHLRVTADTTVIELTDRRVLDPDRPLEGTRWVCVAIIGGRIRPAASLAGMDQVFLVFDRGRVTGSDSIAPLSGSAVVSPATIDFGPGPGVAGGAGSARGELAHHVRATLRGIVRYTIEADELTLTGADTDGLGVGLWLSAVPASAPA